jgi:S1-C subfamily serine protease
MTSPIALMQHQSFAPLVKKVSPAVVNISVTQSAASDTMTEEPEQGTSPGSPNAPFDEFLRRFFDQQNPNGQRHLFPQMPGGQAHRIALGSGFIIDPSGYLVTNSHVVGDASKVEVTLHDDSKYPAKIVGRDPKTDIAVLKIKADKPLPYVTFGDSSAAQVGDWVMAVGNPFGLGGSVTTGIISARGRDIHSGPFDVQSGGPGNRHQYRDLFAQWRQRRDRLRRAVQPGKNRGGATGGAWQSEPRLARRANPGSDAGHSLEPGIAGRARSACCRRYSGPPRGKGWPQAGRRDLDLQRK